MPGREKKAFEAARRDFFTLGKRKIARYHWGNTGPIVLLVHGWNGRGTQLVPFIEPLLDAGYQVLSFDAPGHGHSDGKTTSGMEIIQALQYLARKHGPFKAVITHSFGGLCAAAALAQGMAAHQAVFIAPPANLLGLLDKFSDALRLNGKTTQVIQALGEQQFGADIWAHVSTISNASKLTIPGLIIHDEQDQEVPWQEGAAVAQAWVNARWMKTSGLGHRRILRDRNVLNTIIDFIRSSKTRESSGQHTALPLG